MFIDNDDYFSAVYKFNNKTIVSVFNKSGVITKYEQAELSEHATQLEINFMIQALYLKLLIIN